MAAEPGTPEARAELAAFNAAEVERQLHAIRAREHAKEEARWNDAQWRLVYVLERLVDVLERRQAPVGPVARPPPD